VKGHKTKKGKATKNDVHPANGWGRTEVEAGEPRTKRKKQGSRTMTGRKVKGKEKLGKPV